MKPVMMTKFGDGQGDCLTACVASILEVEIDDIPNLSDFGKEWRKRSAEILSEHGWESIFVPADLLNSLIPSDCLCICIFDTGTHEDHAKLGRWTSTWEAEKDVYSYRVDELHDPHPNPNFECISLRSVFIVYPSPDRKVKS